MLASRISITPQGNTTEWPTHENRNCQPQLIASRRRASGVRPLGRRVRVGSGGRRYRGTSPGERLSALKFHGHALAGTRPRMTSKQGPAYLKVSAACPAKSE